MYYEEPLISASLPLPLFKRGKIRDIYLVDNRLLIVSTDRISAFDIVLSDGIPFKGEAINRLSVYWFKKMEDLIQNHIVDIIDQRTLLTVNAEPIRIEFVIRGYLFGSAWKSYSNGEPISGVRLPSGLRKGDKLQDPILTPTTKEDEGHDREIDMKHVNRIIDNELSKEIEEICIQIYERASIEAEKKGIIIADTKMEFGLYQGKLIIIDELLTPDSSRFWPLDKYKPGFNPPSFDKQYVRDYLTSIEWNKKPPAPKLDLEIIKETSTKYIEAYERLTGRRF
jgi:phosphoribosylaminoimidazole-succinocarboxamide synthase